MASQVSKIKGDEREDLKVLAIGVTAALATRKVDEGGCMWACAYLICITVRFLQLIVVCLQLLQNAWVTEEEFGMGYIDVKPSPSPAKVLATPSVPPSSTATPGPSAVALAGAPTETDAPSSQVHAPSAAVASEDTQVESAARRTENAAAAKPEQPRPMSAPTRPAAVAEAKVSSAQASTAAPTTPRETSAGTSRSGIDISMRSGPSGQGTISGGKGDSTTREVAKQLVESEVCQQTCQRSLCVCTHTHGECTYLHRELLFGWSG